MTGALIWSKHGPARIIALLGQPTPLYAYYLFVECTFICNVQGGPAADDHELL